MWQPIVQMVSKEILSAIIILEKDGAGLEADRVVEIGLNKRFTPREYRLFRKTIEAYSSSTDCYLQLAGLLRYRDYDIVFDGESWQMCQEHLAYTTKSGRMYYAPIINGVLTIPDYVGATSLAQTEPLPGVKTIVANHNSFMTLRIEEQFPNCELVHVNYNDKLFNLVLGKSVKKAYFAKPSADFRITIAIGAEVELLKTDLLTEKSIRTAKHLHALYWLQRVHRNLKSNVPFQDLPIWFRKAKTTNAVVYLADDGELYWLKGVWHRGMFKGINRNQKDSTYDGK